MTDRSLFAYEDAELVLGLVAPVGTDFERFVETLEVCLKEYRYTTNTVRLSELAEAFKHEERALEGSDEYVRLTRLMDAGNAARAHGGDILALAAAAQINARRKEDSGGGKHPLPRTAHVIRSLKHPGEVQTLRRIYGSGFFLVGIVASETERRQFLKERRGCSETEIKDLLKRDDREADDLGQRTRDTFHLADVFVTVDDVVGLKRFLRLVFGDPYETPTADEYAMFLAFAAGLRSADLSRQVGALVVTADADVVAVGTNDVPIAGGGLCWPGPRDHRDLTLGVDMNEQQRREIVNEVLAALRPPNVSEEDWNQVGWTKLKNAAVMDITEYGRAVHAEMEALLSCARSGVNPRGSTLYSTTFPCHNCAKHILAAGVKRVVYVEPYPKSRAAEMYGASLAQDGPVRDGVVLFESFRGVGPRRFFDLFSIGLSSGYPVKRKHEGKKRDWQPGSAEVRVPLLPNSYITREQRAAEKLKASTRGEESIP